MPLYNDSEIVMAFISCLIGAIAFGVWKERTSAGIFMFVLLNIITEVILALRKWVGG